MVIMDPAAQRLTLELDKVFTSRTFLDSLSEGVVFQGADGAIVDGNEKALELLGLSRDQFLGRTSYDPAWGAVHEDGTPFSGEDHPAMVTLRTEKSLSDVIMGVDTPDGKRRWLSINSHLITDEHGVIGVSTAFIDVTRSRLAAVEANRAHEALEVSERHYRLLAESATDIVIETDHVGLITWSSPSVERILGWTPEELTGTNALSLVADEDVAAASATRTRVMRDHARFHRDSVQDEDGSRTLDDGRQSTGP